MRPSYVEKRGWRFQTGSGLKKNLRSCRALRGVTRRGMGGVESEGATRLLKEPPPARKTTTALSRAAWNMRRAFPAPFAQAVSHFYSSPTASKRYLASPVPPPPGPSLPA